MVQAYEGPNSEDQPPPSPGSLSANLKTRLHPPPPNLYCAGRAGGESDGARPRGLDSRRGFKGPVQVQDSLPLNPTGWGDTHQPSHPQGQGSGVPPRRGAPSWGPREKGGHNSTQKVPPPPVGGFVLEDKSRLVWRTSHRGRRRRRGGCLVVPRAPGADEKKRVTVAQRQPLAGGEIIWGTGKKITRHLH